MVETLVTTYEPRATKVLLDGAIELLGQENFQKMTGLLPADLTFSAGSGQTMRPNWSAEAAGALMESLEAAYGEPGGRGLALRIGRSVFKYALHQFGDQAGLRETQFRLLPAPRRQAAGLAILARVIAEQTGDSIQVTDHGAYWEWRSEKCPLCRGRHSPDACCYLTVGFLQEFMSWAGGGRFYRVTETACRASGSPACVFRIDKKPLD